MSFAIPSLQSGGLIVNYRCSSACGHCLYAAGPKREAGYIQPDPARQALERVRELGCHAVHVGGGEPFLDPDGLRQVLGAAEAAGVAVEYVETNASWFKGPDQADETLTRLRDAGLSCLLVSISQFHNASIPFRKTRGVMESCRRVGLGVFPWVASFIPEIAAFPEDKPHALEEYEARYGKDYVPGLARRYGLTLGGRALETFAPYMPRRPVTELVRESPCGRLTETSHFHVDLFGNYVPGLCAGLSVRLGDLGRPLDEERYPVLNRLYGEGIGGLLEWARAQHRFTAAPGGYVSACQLCTAIRRFLVKDRGVVSHELEPAGFYGAG